MEFRQREDFDRTLDAFDPGELLEHARLTQEAVGRGVFGLDALFVAGDELFEYEFRAQDGLGNALASRKGVEAGALPAPNMRRVHRGEFGGPDSYGCATCHFKGGPDGAGTSTQNAMLRGDGDRSRTADVRSPPHVLGLGPIEALATEMSRELQKQRDEALAAARREGTPVTQALRSKEVEFGEIVVRPDGSVDASGLRGIDPDLVVKPFGWKGHQASIRAMAEESFRIHLGVVSMAEQQGVRDGRLAQARYGDGAWYDVDRDGSNIELDDGMLTTIVAYLAQLEVPIIRPPEGEGLLARFGEGRLLFSELGCARCHRPELVLEQTVITTRAEQREHAGSAEIAIDVVNDGEFPKPEPIGGLRTRFRVRLFSDLKRHDMGPELATPMDQGAIPAQVFLTRPLWGLAHTAPYLHDGRAPTIEDAIRAHGGEAQPERDAYLALDDSKRASLRVFLQSLTRTPGVFLP